jgi:cytochrome c5
MKRFKRNIVSVMLCCSLVTIAAPMLANAFAQEKATKLDGKTIFEQKCLKCHKAEKFKSQHNDQKGWELILSRMERNSCVLSDEEQVVLAEYLAKVHGE